MCSPRFSGPHRPRHRARAGTDPRTAKALRRNTPEVDTGAQLDELASLLEKETPPRHPYAGTTIAIPVGVTPPPIYMLGSSDGGVAYAAKRGLPFAFAHHINPVDAVAMMNRYRDEFVPSAAHPKPHSILALGVVTAKTEAEMRPLERALDLGMVRFAQGLRDLPMPSEAEARDYVFDADEDALREAMRGRFVVGSIDRVATEIHALAHDARADEVMIASHVHDHGKRKDVYTLLRAAL